MGENLPENHSFRLNEDSSSADDGKLYIFVKLTDSCMKTIENAIKAKQKTTSNILFHHHGGEISIPTGNGEKKNYSFQISPEDKTPEVFQCIRQVNDSQLESCGLIEQRLNIHAQEDVYSMTKSKVTEFQKNEELNKKQTKEIGESSKTILEKKTHKSNPPARTTNSANSNAKRTSKPPEQQQQQHHSPNRATTNIFERPLRERLIHFLAVRKYRQPDLRLQLKYGEMREEEKEQLDELLGSLANLSRTGEYLLRKEFFLTGEINPDWPFYSKTDSILVKKKILDAKSMAARPPPPPPRPSLPTLNHKPTKPTNEDSSLTDPRMQQLSEMLEKLNDALSENVEESSSPYLSECQTKSSDQLTLEYNQLLPEYNQLLDYIQSISQKFSPYEEQFRQEQTRDKATKIVEEFTQHETTEGFIHKRQRLYQLHAKLKTLRALLTRNSPSEEFSDEEQ